MPTCLLRFALQTFGNRITAHENDEYESVDLTQRLSYTSRRLLFLLICLPS
jgi:hypothetical protein